MCTVSWLRERRLGASGYRLWFNRDERRTRAPELPAARYETGGVAWLGPGDGEAGGTWIAVNESGLTVGLLNAYAARRGPAPERSRSRGLLVAELVDARDPDEILGRLERADLAPFEPFVLLAVAPDREGLALRWDGSERSVDEGDADLCPLCSSGHDQPAAQRARARVWTELVGECPTTDALDAFQKSHAPDGPSFLSPCMHRPDAATRSQVRITVGPDSVDLVHVPGPPCRTPDGPTLRLARRP